MAQVIDLTTPSTINLVSSEASCGSGQVWSSVEKSVSGDSIGRHYNPTENWMVWTNSSYEPRRPNGAYRQACRLNRWVQSENPFGY